MQGRRKAASRSAPKNMGATVPFSALVGYVIAKRRRTVPLKQGELATKLRLTQSALSRLEGGLVPITVEQLKLAAETLGTTAQSIIGQAEAHAEKLKQKGVRIAVRRNDEAATTPMVAGAALAGLLLILADRASR